jgi:hypothetical protein
MLAALFAGFGLARPDPQSLPDRAIIEQFGERQLLELRPNPDGSPKNYTIYALSRPVGMGQMMLPLDRGRQVVNTASESIPLEPGRTRTITQYYVNQQTAYLRVDFSISGVRYGWLYYNGQRVMRFDPGLPMGWYRQLWSVLNAVTAGIISMFWIPGTTQAQTHTAVIPLTSGRHHISYGGGGYCFALRNANNYHYFDASRLQPGRVFHVRARVWCGGGTIGIARTTEVYLQHTHMVLAPGEPPGCCGGVNQHLHNPWPVHGYNLHNLGPAIALWDQHTTETCEYQRVPGEWRYICEYLPPPDCPTGDCEYVRECQWVYFPRYERVCSTETHDVYRPLDINIGQRSNLRGSINWRPITRTDPNGHTITSQVLEVHSTRDPLETVEVRWR